MMKRDNGMARYDFGEELPPQPHEAHKRLTIPDGYGFAEEFSVSEREMYEPTPSGGTLFERLNKRYGNGAFDWLLVPHRNPEGEKTADLLDVVTPEVTTRVTSAGNVLKIVGVEKPNI